MELKVETEISVLEIRKNFALILNGIESPLSVSIYSPSFSSMLILNGIESSSKFSLSRGYSCTR